MKKKYSIPVNQFHNRKEMEYHGLINGLPAFIVYIMAFFSYYISTIEITICLVVIGTFWLILFMIMTYLFSNARLYASELGLFLKKGKGEQFFPWEQIKEIRFLLIKDGSEPTIPPIKLSIVIYENEEEIVVYIYKNIFRTPLYNYYRFLSLIGCVPKARRLLPNNFYDLLG